MTRLAILCLAAFASPAAMAASVLINSPASLPLTGDAVAGMQLRASPGSWDMALTNGGSTATAANRLTGELASSFTGGGTTMKFTVQHLPGEGFVFTARRTQGSGTTTTTLAWGDFTTAFFATSRASTLNGMEPGAAFNLLSINAESTRSGSEMKIKDLVFTAPGLTMTGNFQEAELEHNGPATNSQWLAADVDLAATAWTLSGEVRMKRSNGSGNDDQVSLTITARQGSLATPVPEPGAASLALLVGGLVLTRRRRA